MRRTVERGCDSSAELEAKGPTVDVSVAQDLGLPVINQEPVIGVCCIAVVDIYLATFAVRDLKLHWFRRLAGARLIDAGLPYAVMVGRDFLADLSWRYCDRSGRVTLDAIVI